MRAQRRNVNRLRRTVLQRHKFGEQRSVGEAGALVHAVKRRLMLVEFPFQPFDLRGKAWHIVVDLAEGWVKILGTEEFEQGMRGRAEELIVPPDP